MFLRFHLWRPEWSSTKLTSVFYHDFFLTLMKPRTTPACRDSGVDRLFLRGPEPLVSGHRANLHGSLCVLSGERHGVGMRSLVFEY